MKSYKVRAEQPGVVVTYFYCKSKKEATDKFWKLLADEWEEVDIIEY